MARVSVSNNLILILYEAFTTHHIVRIEALGPGGRGAKQGGGLGGSQPP